MEKQTEISGTTWKSMHLNDAYIWAQDSQCEVIKLPKKHETAIVIASSGLQAVCFA